MLYTYKGHNVVFLRHIVKTTDKIDHTSDVLKS